jgi:transcriptional regulator with XRE-family HTH domain
MSAEVSDKQISAPPSRKPRSGALDAVLGQRIRRLRRELSLTQSALAERLGITFQQVQKYENGANRVSALMLIKLAEALETTVAGLLQDLETPTSDSGHDQPEVARLVAAFSKINSPEVRASILSIVAALAEGEKA